MSELAEAPAVRRWWVAVPLAAAALWMLLRNEQFRHGEAMAFAPLVSLVTGGHDAVAAGSIIWFARNGDHPPLGLDVTSECTTALLIVPLIVVMGGFAVFSRIPLPRVLGALAAGIGLLVLCNTVRVAGIAFATNVWGMNPGYEYSHTFVGSALALIGFVGSIAVSIWLLVRGRRISAEPVSAVETPTAPPVVTVEDLRRSVAVPAGGRHARHEPRHVREEP